MAPSPTLKERRSRERKEGRSYEQKLLTKPRDWFLVVYFGFGFCFSDPGGGGAGSGCEKEWIYFHV